MPTRVQMTATPSMIEDDKSDAGRSVSTADSGSADSVLNVGSNSDILANGRDIACEPGELRLRSPAEPGEVIRQENGQDNSSKLVPKFSMTNPNKQTSVMQSLFSSLMPPSSDNQGNAFWSSFIQQTAAAAAVHKANQQLNIETNSDNELNCSERDEGEGRYLCKVEGCNSVFDTQESRDVHSMNVTLHCKMFENNQSIESGDSGNQTHECIFCDKCFSSKDALAKHSFMTHQGQHQQPLFNDQNFSAQMDSIKSKTPLIA